MLRHLGWDEAADLIVKGLEQTIASRVVTYDFARLMDEPTEVKCSEFRRSNYREHVVADALTHLDEQGRLKMVDVAPRSRRRGWRGCAARSAWPARRRG